MTGIFGILPPESIPDPGLEHVTNVRERAIGTAIAQFRDKARFITLIDIFTRPMQELENVFWDLYTLRDLVNGVGTQLDVIGAIVQEARGGLADDDYRAILRIKILVLRSKGTAEDLIKICRVFLDTENFTYDELYPAKVVITVTDSITTDRLALLKKFLRKGKSGGVALDVVDATFSSLRFHNGVEGTSIISGYGHGHYGSII